MSRSEPLRDGLKFLRLALRKPREMGAVLPSSRALGRAMAGAAARANGRPVLELGPGTGSVTAAILKAGVRPQNLVAVERSEELLPELQQRFPGVHFIGGDAFCVDELLNLAKPDWRGQFGAVVSSLPLLNFPAAARERLLEQLAEWIHPTGKLVQFSYSLRRSKSFRNLEEVSSKVVWMNVPPARVSEFSFAPRRPGRTKSMTHGAKE